MSRLFTSMGALISHRWPACDKTLDTKIRTHSKFLGREGAESRRDRWEKVSRKGP